MTWTRIPCLLAITLAACTAGDDDLDCAEGRCDQTCSDPRYGDGTCDPSLPCAVPDIDCFRTFADDAAGAAWFAELEGRIAANEGRAARRVVPEGDPRFAPVRELLDRGWEAMRTNRPVGRLARERPALVIVEDETVNAFVMPEDLDQQRASFAVMVHTGTLAIPTTDDANLGLMMHELQHAVGLHVVASVKEGMALYYLADEGYEPIGREQRDDPGVREAASLWRARASEIGHLVNAELRGLPMGGDLQVVLRRVVQAGAQANPNACANARALLTSIAVDIDTATDPISGAVALGASFGPRVTAALAALRTECVPSAPSFVEVVAELGGTTPQQIEAQLGAEDRALIGNKHIVDAIAALTEDRRAKMRAVEAAVPEVLGRPWTAIRYFSEEEDADDTSVPVLRAAGLDPAGLGTFLADVLLDPPASAACKDLLRAGAIPAYGVNLDDTHHGTCWRVHHIDQLAAAGRARPRKRIQVHAPVEVPRLPRLPHPIAMH
ncbi:MAG: hypothetical protein KF773_31165 [Deltaproteobacteria bacterium]|nr:hypothetical protein [Deltaproteobacteria bacterium]